MFPELQAGSSGGADRIKALSTSSPSCSPKCECFPPSGNTVSLVLMNILFLTVLQGAVLKVFSLSISIE